MFGKKWVIVVLVSLAGCNAASNSIVQNKNMPNIPIGDHLYQSLKMEYPDTRISISDQKFDIGPLSNFNFGEPGNFLRLSLDQCIENALRESKVIRDLGGTVLRSPELVRTEDDPALAYTDPATGEEAALSEFDASFSNQFLYQDNDRAFNSSFIGDQGLLVQDTATNNTTLSKRSATGGLFQLSHQLLYDRNNTPANRFDNDTSYDTFLQAEVRQPLLQGAGSAFNRIAGPGNPVGVNNGVLIARTNTDINLADFEIGIRNLVSDVENAYWDLYFAYRDLEAKIEARNGAYRIWTDLKAQEEAVRAAEILQAEEQYYLFASRVEDAIYGQRNDGTRTNNGSSSGTFRGNAGVRTAERRLRLLGGFPVNDNALILPIDMPIEAVVIFDWNQSKSDALVQRTELRRQRWVLKREQLNLYANKKQIQPRLDLIGRYRVRGFGNDLFGDTGFDPDVAPGVDPQNGSAAFATFLDGDLQEWELGVDVDVPIGYRRQRAAVRNSQLRIMREKKILHEQEREIIFGLSNALGELDRTASLLDVNTKRLEASKRQYEAIVEEWREDNTTIDLVLESQRRVIDAKVDFFRTQVEFMLGVKSVHFEKGTQLQYHNVTLTENGWCRSDLQQAAERESLKSRPLNYVCHGLRVSTPLNQSPITFSDSYQQIANNGGDTTVNANQLASKSSRKTANNSKKVASAKKAASKDTDSANDDSLFDDSILTKLAKKIENQQSEQKAASKTSNRIKKFLAAKTSNKESAEKPVAGSSNRIASRSSEKATATNNNSKSKLALKSNSVDKNKNAAQPSESILAKLARKLESGRADQKHASNTTVKLTDADSSSRRKSISRPESRNRKPSMNNKPPATKPNQQPTLKLKSVNEFLSSFRKDGKQKKSTSKTRTTNSRQPKAKRTKPRDGQPSNQKSTRRSENVRLSG